MREGCRQFWNGRGKGTLLVLFLVPVLRLLLPRGAEANVQEVFGFSARAAGMGNAFTAIAEDFSACYYNPAGLAQLDHHRVTVGYAFCQPRLKQHLLSSPGKTHSEESTSFQSIIFGSTVDLTRIFDTRGHNLVLGVAGCLGGDDFRAGYRIHDWRPEVPRFLRYGDYANRTHVFSGLGLEVFKEKLWVGAGFNLWQTLNVEDLDAQMDFGSNVVAKELNVNGEFEMGPIAGLLFKPFPWLALGYAYRDEMAQDDLIRVTAVLDLAGFPVTLEEVFLHFRDYFLPWNMTLAVLARPAERLLVSLDLTYYHWSDFSLPAWEGRIQEWENTVLPRLGLEYGIRQDLVLRAGYFYEASPVPDQRDILSNQLDFDRHVLSVGLGYVFSALPCIGELPFQYPISVDAFFQYQWMQDREQKKDPSTAQEGWRIEGYQIATGLGLTVGFR